MPNRFTERAQRLILIAQEEGRRTCHDYIGTEHLLLGLIALGEGAGVQVLRNLNVNLKDMRSEVEKIIGNGTLTMLIGEIPFTPGAKRVLEFAVEEAQHLGHSYVGTEHILLGMIREGEGVAARVLETLGLQLGVVRNEVRVLLGETPDRVFADDSEAPIVINESCLPGATLTNIEIGEHSLRFGFALPSIPPKVAKTLSIGVRGKWELRDGSGKVVDNAKKNSERSEYRVHLVIGKRVKELGSSPQKGLEIIFEDGHVLGIYDRSP